MLGPATLRDDEYNKPSPLERSLKFMKKLNDPRFGEVQLMQNPATRENVFVRERKYNDKAEAARAILATRARMANQSPYSLKLLDYSSAKQSELCSTIYIVRQFWEAPGADLRREFSQRQSAQNYFTDAELSYIVYNIIRGDSAGAHGDICPNNICYDRATNTAKLIDRSDEPPSPNRTIQIQKNKLINPQNIYQSPNMYSNLKRNNLKFGIDGSKEDAFSLGLTMLELGNLKPISNIYDATRKEVDPNILQNHLTEFNGRYGKNSFLSTMVNGFTRVNENDRLGMREADSSLLSEADFRSRIGSGAFVSGAAGGLNTMGGGGTTVTTTTTTTDGMGQGRFDTIANAGAQTINTQTTTTYSGNLRDNPFIQRANLSFVPPAVNIPQPREYSYNPPKEIREFNTRPSTVETQVIRTDAQPAFNNSSTLEIRAAPLNAGQFGSQTNLNPPVNSMSTFQTTTNQMSNLAPPQNFQQPAPLPLSNQMINTNAQPLPSMPQNNIMANQAPLTNYQPAPPTNYQPAPPTTNYQPPLIAPAPIQNYATNYTPAYGDSVRHEFRTNGMVVDPPVIHDYKGIDSSFSSTRSFDSGRYYSPVSPIGAPGYSYDYYAPSYPRSFTDNYIAAPVYSAPYSAASNRIVLEPEIRQEFVTAPVTTTYSSASNVVPMVQPYIEAPMSLAPQVVYAGQPTQTLMASAAPQVLYSSAIPETYTTAIAAPTIQTIAAPSIVPQVISSPMTYTTGATTILPTETIASSYVMPRVSVQPTTTLVQAAPTTYTSVSPAVTTLAPTFSSATNVQTISAAPLVTGASIVPETTAVSGLKLVRTYQDPKFSTVI